MVRDEDKLLIRRYVFEGTVSLDYINNHIFAGFNKPMIDATREYLSSLRQEHFKNNVIKVCKFTGRSILAGLLAAEMVSLFLRLSYDKEASYGKMLMAFALIFTLTLARSRVEHIIGERFRSIEQSISSRETAFLRTHMELRRLLPEHGFGRGSFGVFSGMSRGIRDTITGDRQSTPPNAARVATTSP